MNALAKAAGAIHSNAINGLSLRNADPKTYPKVVGELVGALKPIMECIEQVLREQPALANDLETDRLRDAQEKISALIERR